MDRNLQKRNKKDWSGQKHTEGDRNIQIQTKKDINRHETDRKMNINKQQQTEMNRNRKKALPRVGKSSHV